MADAKKLIEENLRTKNSSLDLSSNELVGTEPFLEILKDCIHLKSLSLAGNNLRSITFLSNLNFLTSLNLDINPIQDISPIQNLSLLEDLYLNQTQVTDLLPLKDCKRLRKLNLFLTKIKYNIDTLNELYNLEELLIQFDDINEGSYHNSD
ncbi:MAG: hypothetical protein NW226_05950 [Microscillaceae bacterium]|nr:hypothetical protein [Microscillaceae bacterium]